MTTNRSRGNATVTSLRLCSRAPRTTSWSWGTSLFYRKSSIPNRRSVPSLPIRGRLAEVRRHVRESADEAGDDRQGHREDTDDGPSTSPLVGQHQQAERADQQDHGQLADDEAPDA